MLTVKKVAERAAVSASLVYKWVAECRLPHYRLGGRGRRGKIIIDESELREFLSSCHVTEEPDEDGPLSHIR